MKPPCCYCEFETVSEPVGGVLHCAVCKLPKRRAGAPERLLTIPEAAAVLGLGADNLRALVATGSVKATVMGNRRALLLPSHVLAQLAQKGIRPRGL